MEIRSMTARDDPAAVAEVYVESWRAAYRGLLPQDYLDGLTPERWASRLGSGEFPSLLLLHGDHVAGTSSFGPSRDRERPGWGEVISLYLKPEAWGRGWGKALFQRALEELERMGYSKVFLWVLRENERARRFYERMGFRDAGRTTSCEIGGQWTVEVCYEKDGGGTGFDSRNRCG